MTMPARTATLIGPPLALAVLLALHPPAEGADIYGDIRDSVALWLAVHLGLLGCVTFVALALRRVLAPMQGTAARLARLALWPFVICFVAWESSLGIGGGMLVEHANGLPAGAERDAVAAAIQHHFENALIGDLSIVGSVGNAAWIFAAVAAALAARRAGHRGLVVGLIGTSSLFTLHATLLAPIALACLCTAVVMLDRAAQGHTPGDRTSPTPHHRTPR